MLLTLSERRQEAFDSLAALCGRPKPTSGGEPSSKSSEETFQKPQNTIAPQEQISTIHQIGVDVANRFLQSLKPSAKAAQP